MNVWDMLLWTAVAIPVAFLAMALVSAASAPPDPFE
jgi:hypothetical protein